MPTPAVAGSAGKSSLRGSGLRMKASKVCSTRLLNILSGFARRILELHDIHLIAVTLAHQFDRVGGRAGYDAAY